MLTIPAAKIKNREDAKRALLAKYGSLKNACFTLHEKTRQRVDYDNVRMILNGNRTNKREVTIICQELGIKPEVLTGGQK